MIWRLSYRSDPDARQYADRHYSRQKIGADGFVPPGRCLVLVAEGAYWVTSWPFAEYVKHRWPGAWICSAFRREPQCQGPIASEMIRQAVAATREKWPETPALGMVTFVNRYKVAHKRDPGRCFLRAGFKPDGETVGGLLAFRLRPEDMPDAEKPMGMGGQTSLFEEREVRRAAGLSGRVGRWPRVGEHGDGEQDGDEGEEVCGE
jgi:hypothetical protein